MENREPIGLLMAGWGAALAVLLWAIAGALYLALSTSPHPCAGVPINQPCGPRSATIAEAAWMLLTLCGAVFVTLGAALGTLVAAGRSREWRSFGGFLGVTALALVALYALTRGTMGGVVYKLYGFSPEQIGTHPVAFGAAIAHLVLPAPAALAYSLLPERAPRASGLVNLAALVGAVGLLVVIHLAPAVSLPN